MLRPAPFTERKIDAMDALILYALVLLFLVAFTLLVFVFVQKPAISVQAQHNSTSAHGDRVSYGLILAFFVFFSVLTFLVRRGKSP
jgi:phosphate starvation-inducible membrane PsiE